MIRYIIREGQYVPVKILGTGYPDYVEEKRGNLHLYVGGNGFATYVRHNQVFTPRELAVEAAINWLTRTGTGAQLVQGILENPRATLVMRQAALKFFHEDESPPTPWSDEVRNLVDLHERGAFVCPQCGGDCRTGSHAWLPATATEPAELYCIDSEIIPF